jgi:hypothetical protein
MTIFKRTHLLALAIVFCLVAGSALAQESKETQVSGGVTVGAQTGNHINDSSKLQQYETVPKGVSLYDVDLAWKNASRYFLTFQGTKLGLDDQSALFQAGRKGNWKISLSLDQNPRWFSNTAETLYNQSAPGIFTLPDGMRATLQRVWSPATSDPKAPADSNDARFWDVRDYMNGAQPVDLRYVRKTGRAALEFSALKDFDFTVSYQRETRDGTQPLAFTAGPGIDEVANPVHFTTQDARIEMDYAKKSYFINATFARNTFSNDVPFTTVDNPVRLNNTDFFWTASTVNNTSANAAARLWNAPDNQATSVDLTAGLKLPSHHKVTFTTSVDNMTMDRTLIPQATNPLLNLATTSADYGKFTLTPEYPSINARLLQSLFMFNFTGDPTPKFGYSAWYRAFNVTNKKGAYIFHSTVNSDGGASYSAAGITSTEDMGGYSTGQFKAEAHFTPMTGLRFGVNAGRLKSNFEDRMYFDTAETTFGVSGDVTHKWTSLHASYTRVSRQPGAIDPDEPAEGTSGGPLDIHADMKDVARMNGNLYNAALTLTPLDKAAFTFSVQGIDSDFPDTSIGLSKSTVRNYGVDLVYAVNERLSLNGGYIYETYHMDSNFWYGANGTVTNPVATNTIDKYFNTIADKVDTYQAGFRWDAVPGKVDIRTDYNYSKGRSDQSFTIVPGGQLGGDLYYPTTATPNFPIGGPYLTYPQVFNATTIWKTTFSYHLQKNVTLSLLYWKQKFDHADWATDNLGLYLLPGSALYATTPGAVANIYPLLDPSANRAIFLGATTPNYDANIFRASIIYRF